ncbi:MAG: signal peptidase I [Bacillota bacterium]|nr:signal peptidase I [Bacillota bacterium]
MNNFWKAALGWVKELLIVVVVVVVFNLFFVVSTVYNVSMYPTLQDRDIVLLAKFGEIKQGDIVSFRSMLTLSKRDLASVNFFQRLFNREGDRKVLIKRVLACPGDTIAIKEGKVYLNGVVLYEPYVKEIYEGKDFEEQVVPENSYFLVGDNRPRSFDGRDFGFVKKEDIIGKVLFRFWPLNRMGKP